VSLVTRGSSSGRDRVHEALIHDSLRRRNGFADARLTELFAIFASLNQTSFIEIDAWLNRSCCSG
jgi:hypothetical protein